MKAKNVREYCVRVLNGMAKGLFASLIIGLILKQAGVLLGIPILEQFGKIAQYLMGPAIGAGIAVSVGASELAIFSSLIAGAIGAGTIQLVDGQAMLAIGEPVGALLASLLGAEASKVVQGKTKVDIVVVPFVTILIGGLVGIFLAPFFSTMMGILGAFINRITQLRPLPMGILLSVLMGLILTLPISSAALAISLGLAGLAAGASTVGCACQMVGFAVMSFEDNRWGGLISQGLGTSMLQIGNIIKNPWIWLPPTLASAILGPIASVVFQMENNKIGAGMGTSGLVGQFATWEVMGQNALVPMILLHFIFPGILSYLFYRILKSMGKIKDGDLKL